MSENIFDFHIEGDHLSPSTMSYFELAPFLQAFCEAVEAEGRKRGIQVNLGENSVNLVHIDEGSLLLKYIGRSEQMMGLLASIVSAFTFSYTGTPAQKTIDFVKSTADLSKRNGYTVSCFSPYISQHPIKLADKDYQPPKYEIQTFKESTWIYGSLVSIGGKTTPTAHIVSIDGRNITCKLNKDLAQKMALQLYGTVLHIIGEASYEYNDNWILNDFIIHDFSVMKSTGIVQAVQSIKPYLVEKYNSIDDIDSHFRNMRD
jgi:hypothetical protein